MRAVWVDAGNDADYGKLTHYGIDSPYYALNDPRVTAAYLQGVADRGFKPGLYVAWNWFSLDGPGLASHVHAELLRIGWAGNPPVCVDIEKGHGLTDANYVAYVLAFLKRWRELRPKRLTYYTLEGYQGGLFDAKARLAVAASGVVVVPQCYTGAMVPYDPVDVMYDLWRHGFAPAGAVPFYDAAHLPTAWGWSGFAFTMGRLP
jgi:hypothetical protein